MSSTTILLALDGTEAARWSLPIARALAEINEASLRIVHVAERSLSASDLPHRVGLDRDAVAGSVLDPRSGEPAFGIISAAAEIDPLAIVLSTHTALDKPKRTLGRTALSVLRATRCPVFFVRPERGDAPWTLRRMLLPHDGSPTTSMAIRPAGELARRVGAEIAVLNVAAAAHAVPHVPGAVTTPRYVDHPQHEWPAWAGEFVERLASICPLGDVRVRMSLATGEPDTEILRFAGEHAIDLIVLAWGGEWERDRATIVQNVVRDATCPTMIVRA